MKILESFVASPFAGTIGWTLLHSLWEGAAISALLATVVLATRSARVRYAAACVAMIAMVVAFVVTIYRLMPESAENFPRFRAMVPLPPPSNVVPQADTGHSWLLILSILAPWLAPFWIGGMLLLSLQRVMSCVAVRRLRSRGVCFASEEWHAELARLAAQLHISRPVHLLESCFAEIPMVLGHLRPVILMPIGLLANLPSQQVETILLHELAHIRRCDYLLNAVQRIIESALFYHPAVWWFSKVMRTERENCCDDVVVSVTRHANEYAQALATLERSRLPRQEAAVAATGGTLVKRIRRLLYPKAPAGVWAPVAAATIFVVTAAVSFAAWQPKTAQLAVAGLRARVQPAAASGQAVAQTDPLAAESGSKIGPYWRWLDEDVVYIITAEERDTFLHLKSDEERDAFIKAFWGRRNPTPGSVDNKFKDEHYRRIAYANEHFLGQSTPGWKTDRGRIYIMWGPPDQREEHTEGENSRSFSYEYWRYHQITGLNGKAADNVEFEFDDPNGSGDFYLVKNPSEKAARSAAQGAAADQTDPLAQDLREWIILRLPLRSSVTASAANGIVAKLLLQYGPSHAEYDQTQNVIIVRGTPNEIASARHLVDLANQAVPKTSASSPRLQFIDGVATSQETKPNGQVFSVSTTAEEWLDEDVVYIITDQERKAYLALNTDEERQQFVKAFWERRNPTPGSADNRFKDEHYRRIAYANEHFATPSGKAGWQTDRGHIYIVYGPPDARNHFLPGQNGSQFATEQWRYDHIEGVGDNLMFGFVDREGTGDFVLVPSPSNSQVASKKGPNRVAEPDENAKHGVTILSSTEGVNFTPYINGMLKSIQANWYKAMPQEAMKGQAAGQVSIIFSIQPDGKLGDLQIASSSGVQSLDEAALDAVRGSSPLQPLPNQFHGPALKLKLTFAYNQPLHS